MQAIPAFYLLDRNWRAIGAADTLAHPSDHRPDDAVVQAARHLARQAHGGDALIAQLGDRRIVRLVALNRSPAVEGASYALFVEHPAAA